MKTRRASENLKRAKQLWMGVAVGILLAMCGQKSAKIISEFTLAIVRNCAVRSAGRAGRRRFADSID